jgi:hypothetical protein
MFRVCQRRDDFVSDSSGDVRASQRNRTVGTVDHSQTTPVRGQFTSTRRFWTVYGRAAKFVFRSVAQSPGWKYDDRHPLDVGAKKSRNSAYEFQSLRQQNFRTGVARGWVGVSGL